MCNRSIKEQEGIGKCNTERTPRSMGIWYAMKTVVNPNSQTSLLKTTTKEKIHK